MHEHSHITQAVRAMDSCTNANFDQFRFLGNDHLPLPKVNINTYFSLRAKCWLEGGVVGPFPRNLNKYILILNFYSLVLNNHEKGINHKTNCTFIFFGNKNHHDSHRFKLLSLLSINLVLQIRKNNKIFTF